MIIPDYQKTDLANTILVLPQLATKTNLCFINTCKSLTTLSSNDQIKGILNLFHTQINIVSQLNLKKLFYL